MTPFEERFLETVTLKTTDKPIYLQFIVNRTRGKPSTWNGFRLKVVNRRSTVCSTCVQALVFGFRLVALLAIASLATSYENWKHCPNHWWRASVVFFLRHTVICSISFFILSFLDEKRQCGCYHPQDLNSVQFNLPVMLADNQICHFKSLIILKSNLGVDRWLFSHQR